MYDIKGRKLQNRDIVTLECVGYYKPVIVVDVENQLFGHIGGENGLIVRTFNRCKLNKVSVSQIFTGVDVYWGDYLQQLYNAYDNYMLQHNHITDASCLVIGDIIISEDNRYYIYLGELTYRVDYEIIMSKELRTLSRGGGGKHCFLQLSNNVNLSAIRNIADLLHPTLVGNYEVNQLIVTEGNLNSYSYYGRLRNFNFGNIDVNLVNNSLHGKAIMRYKGRKYLINKITLQLTTQYSKENLSRLRGESQLLTG